MGEIDSTVVLNQVLCDPDLTEVIKKSRVLLVGAGGIGSEVIKDLLLMGLTDINLIDLDTIDVSNLNRQFLFNKSHVGHSKAEIAAKVAKQCFGHNNEVKVNAIHNSIQSSEFDVDFYKSHTLVINALDNRAARSHVNRMCLASGVPLIESGSEGYMGQVFLIAKDVSQCYECEGPKQDSRTFASCTIRNTPSLPIHCIVWAKHLFAQLFGEEDADNDVSPDMGDPELSTSDSTKDAEDIEANGKPVRAQSTRAWAQQREYETKLLFNKLFRTDIEYLLRMEKLWESRQRPIAISYESVADNQIDFNGCEGSSRQTNGSSTSSESLKDQRLWSMKECLDTFDESLKQLKSRLDSEKFLVWDKDDKWALNFVTAVSNLRSFCFHIERKSKFDVKSMAGNIIPAISSTNSIIGGLITLQCLNVLRNLKNTDSNTDTKESKDKLYESGKHSYLRKVGPSAKNLISSYDLPKPNTDCLVCSDRGTPEIEISLSLSETTISDFVDDIIFGKLHFACPDIQVDGESTVLWSKDDFDESSDEEKERIRKKLLSDYPSVRDKIRFRVYDLVQTYAMIITLRDVKIDKNENDGLFYQMVITKEGVKSEEEKPELDVEPIVEANVVSNRVSVINTNNVNKINEGTDVLIEDKGSDVEEVIISDTDSESSVIIDDDSADIIEMSDKRKVGSDSENSNPAKKLKLDSH